jgi:hypothetical protein
MTGMRNGKTIDNGNRLSRTADVRVMRHDFKISTPAMCTRDTPET